MPNLRTTITELVTGLGMLGHPSVGDALAARPAQMVSVSPEVWDQLAAAWAGGAHAVEFEHAFANGAAFLRAPAGLRDRVPLTVEWKGSQRAPGVDVAPVDLRIDHVYLVSCKYLSKILFNASPSHLFDGLLSGTQGRRSGDWYLEVASGPYEALYRIARTGTGSSDLPPEAASLTSQDRRRLRVLLREQWPVGAPEAWQELAGAVARASARRWQTALAGHDAHDAMFWRLLRMGNAPYFVLGQAGPRPLRLRIATPWDWRQRFRLEELSVEAQEGGQPRVGWIARIRDLERADRSVVSGHVEVRWSHGRFAAPPEAKVYLDSPHPAVPGYFPLEPTTGPFEPTTRPLESTTGPAPDAASLVTGGESRPSGEAHPLQLFGPVGAEPDG